MEKMEREIDEIKKELCSLRLWTLIGIAVNVVLFMLKTFLPIGGTGMASSVHGNNVQIGAGISPENPQRDYLRTDEVAEREGVAPRTVLEWVYDGRISPPPIKTDRAWQFAADYRILPQTAAAVAGE
jgi:hypothetical protein